MKKTSSTLLYMACCSLSIGALVSYFNDNILMAILILIYACLLFLVNIYNKLDKKQ